MRALDSRIPDAVPAGLLLLVGVALLLNPVVPGVHLGEGEVTRYEAARVTYDDAEGLRVVDVSSGERLRFVDVDGIQCEELWGRVCHFEHAVLEGAEVRGPADSPLTDAPYTYVYLDDTLYRQTAVEGEEGATAALEPADEDPLGRIAMAGDYSRPVGRAIDGETVVVHGELDVEGRLLEHEGAYYTVHATASKRYGGGGSFCASNGEGFCETADAKRTTDTLLTLGSRVLGGLLLLTGYERRGAG